MMFEPRTKFLLKISYFCNFCLHTSTVEFSPNVFSLNCSNNGVNHTYNLV